MLSACGAILPPFGSRAALQNQRQRVLYSREGFPCAFAGPCFAVTVVLNETTASGHAFALAATIMEDRYTTVTPLSATKPGVKLCL